MTTSVVIATFNRARLLDECLEHLRQQAFCPGDEVVLVDNHSVDETQAVIARHARAFPALIIHLDEPRPGKSHALARALAVARGTVLAFTDDDVNVAPDWLAEIRRTMSDEGVALVGGPVAPRWERRPPRWLGSDPTRGRLAAPLALLDYGPQPGPLGARAAIGANLAVRRDVLRRVGGFATTVGKLTGTLLSGEDSDLCQRVGAAGFRTAYVPSARVFHWVPAARVRVRYFLSWYFWSGISYALLEDASTPAGRAIAGVPLYLMRRLVAGTLGAAAAIATGRGSAAMERITEAAFAAGYALQRWGVVSPAVARPVLTAGRTS